MTKKEVIAYLEPFAEEKNLAGMARFGIDPKNGIGVGMVPIREIAKKIKKDDSLSDELWESNIHELKILAILIRDKKSFTEELADSWVEELYSWDICDQFSMKLIPYLEFSDKLIYKWASDEREFVRRAAFASVSGSVLHKKKWDNEPFFDYLELCKKYSFDNRNFVKKAVNWAIRQIGKRNMELREKALIVCNQILDEYNEFPSARWIAKDAVRELEKPDIIERIKKKSK
jgi:3-methyladenine DNA glycosylase AlkD